MSVGQYIVTIISDNYQEKLSTMGFHKFQKSHNSHTKNMYAFNSVDVKMIVNIEVDNNGMIFSPHYMLVKESAVSVTSKLFFYIGLADDDTVPPGHSFWRRENYGDGLLGGNSLDVYVPFGSYDMKLFFKDLFHL